MQRLAILILIISSTSCASLTKTQVKLTRNYFQTIGHFVPDYKQLNEEVADIILVSQNLESALQQSDSAKVDMIINSISAYETGLILPDSITSHLAVIENYIQSYYVLIPDGFDALKALKSTGDAIVGLFGFKGIVSAIAPNASLSVSAARKRRIKRHLTGSSENLHHSIRALRSYLHGYYRTELNAIDAKSRDSFKYLLQSMRERPDAIQYYKDLNLLLIRYYQRLFLAKRLVQTLDNMLAELSRTEPEILQKTATREKINPESRRVNIMLKDAQRTSDLVHDLKKFRTP